METPTTTPVAEPTPKTALWEDFIDIFFSPREVFERRRDGRFWLALIVLTVLMGFLFFASQKALGPIYEIEFQRGMEAMGRDNPQISQEQMQQMQGVSQIFGTIGFLVTFPIGILILGLVFWILAKVFGAALTVAMGMVVATYSQFPKLVQSVLSIFQGLILDVNQMDSIYDVTLSPARFVDQDAGPMLAALLGRLDLFVIWTTVLVALGMVVMGRMPRGKAIVFAIIAWVLGAIPALFGAMRAAG